MRRLIFAILLLLSLAPSLFAQANYYQGKQIKVVVGFTAGGFYDRWARLLARFMPKYIPGNPEMMSSKPCRRWIGGRYQLCLQRGQTRRSHDWVSKQWHLSGSAGR